MNRVTCTFGGVIISLAHVSPCPAKSLFMFKMSSMYKPTVTKVHFV